MIKEQTSVYRNTMKGIAIFGGVQVLQIIIAIVRGKIVAVLLGPAGSGINALFSSTTNIITQFSSLGLNLSAVRSISQANETGDQKKLNIVVQVFRRWIWVTGLSGAFICLVFAEQFSVFAFGNTSYTWGFVFLSIALLLNALASGESALLQGTHKLKDLAKASMVGSVVGLLTALPLFFFWGLKGIVPAIIAASISAFVANRYFSNKIPLAKSDVTVLQTVLVGQDMAKIGIVMMLASVVGTIATYILNAFISQKGGVSDVGLYQSGTSITNQYLSLVFTSMAIDYFPKLSAVSENRLKIRDLVNQQSILVMLIITPMLVGLISFAPLLIRSLLSVKYLPAVSLVQWISLGMILKAASFPLGYISFAKGDKKTFFWMEGIFGNGLNLALNIIGYILWGIEGLGISFLIGYTLYAVVLTIVVYRVYDFSFSAEFVEIFFCQILFCLSAFVLAINLKNNWIGSLSGFILLGMSLLYSWILLDKLMDFRKLLKEKRAGIN